jgi:hypothetical protein
VIQTISCKRWSLLAGSALLMTVSLSAAAMQDDETAGRDESWQIEQRQQWFVESRDLLAHPDASRLRAGAVDELKRQNEMLAGTRAASGEVWQEMGPSSMNMVDWIMGRVAGRINAITPLPGNDDVVYVGSAAGGVWKTTNAGLSWAPIFDEVGTLPIGAIAIDASAPSTVWVGTGDKNSSCGGYFGQGVYLSEDAGASWIARNGSGLGTMPLSIVNAVAIQPTDSNVILVGGSGTCNSGGGLSGAGAWRSTDKGLSWTKVLSNNVEDIVFVPGSSTVYAGLTSVGVQKSVDGGETWTPASTGINASGTRLRLAMAPSNSNILYALVGTRLYRTDDGGASWVLKNSGTSVCGGQCSYNQTISVHPGNPDTLLVGTILIARSTDAGVTITPLVSSWGSAQKVHQDTHVVRYSLIDPNRFWVGSDGGIWRSDDSAASFRNMNANINITQFYDVAVNPDDANIIFGGAQDNSSSGRRTSLLWNLTYASGDGFMNAFDQNNPSIVFQTSYPSGSTNKLPSIVRSVVGGSPGSFSGVSNAGITAGPFEWVTPLATAGSQLFVASDALYRTNTSGGSWTAISGNLGSAAVVITPQKLGTLTPTYVGTSGGKIWASPDAGIPLPVFSDVTGNYPGGRVSDVAMDPMDPQRVFITRGSFGASRLYRSTTGGSNWSAVGAGLPNVPANSVAIDPLDTTRIFVGTDIGVYESTDNGDNFIAFSSGLPLGVVVSDLEIDDYPHVLTAGTYSRGAWRALLNGSLGNSPPTADFDVVSNGLDATFSDRSIDIDGSIVAYLWDFGDGSATSSDASPLHTYPAPGSYTVSVTVTDDGGLSASYGKIVRFSAPPIALVNGVALTNQSAAQGDDVYYTLEVPTNAVDLHFETSSPVGGADADLTVKLNGNVLCQSAGSTSAEHCDFAMPAPGTYTAIVNAYTTLTNYTILGSFVAPPDAIFANGFD